MENQHTDDIDPRTAIELLWNEGELTWLFHDGQKKLYDSYINCQDKTIVWNASRRVGKSYTLCVLAIETCLKKPNSLIKYCCAKQNDARGIIRPLIREILETCPKELKPQFKTQDRAWVFPNGSRIELSGLDGGRAEGLRGGACDLAIVDEAGLVSDLKYIVTSIITPTTLTTGGKIILASTPPKSSGHAFVDYVNVARIKNNLTTLTIYDNPLIDEIELNKIIEEYGGVDSVAFRREFKCEIILDTDYAVVPEFTLELKSKIVKEWPRPPFYDTFTAMDLGLRDLTVVLFAYYDFRAGKIIVENEFVINGQKMNTASLAEGIRRVESETFTDPYTGEQKTPLMRVSDNNLIVIQDLRTLHGLSFLPTRKDDSDAALNRLRMLVANEQLIINPKCKTFIFHLETAVWNKNRTSYERSAEGGHADSIDAAKYLVRNIDLNRNPYPKNFGMVGMENRFNYNNNPYSPGMNEYAKILSLKKR